MAEEERIQHGRSAISILHRTGAGFAKILQKFPSANGCFQNAAS